MGWSIGYDHRWGRDIGYGVPAVCDHPRCSAEIARGLSFVCGGQPYGEPYGCGLFFCETHRQCIQKRDGTLVRVCPRCAAYKPPYRRLKADTPEWIRHKLDDPSWADWRAAEPETVAALRARLALLDIGPR